MIINLSFKNLYGPVAIKWHNFLTKSTNSGARLTEFRSQCLQFEYELYLWDEEKVLHLSLIALFIQISMHFFCAIYYYRIYHLIVWDWGEGNGIPLQYSCLENPMDGGAWWAAIHRVAISRTRLSNFTFTFHFHALEKEMATHSSVLAWRIPGTGEPGGLPSTRSHRVRHDWSDLT